MNLYKAIQESYADHPWAYFGLTIAIVLKMVVIALS